MFLPSAAPGSSTVTYTASNGACFESMENTITVEPAPLANAGPDSEICGTTHTLQGGINSGSGSWTGPPAITFVPDASDPEAVITAATPGTYILTWSVSNGSCSSSDQVTITFFEVGPPIWVDAGPDQRIALLTSTSLVGNATAGAELQWSILQGSGYFTNPASTNTNVDGLAVGLNTYILSAWMGNCSSAQDTVVVLVDDFFIPEGFSPNGDGVNDRFEITGMEAFPGSLIQVFDRAGQKVYDHSSYDNSWDGRANNGKPLPDGTFFYILNISPERSYNGHIILKH